MSFLKLCFCICDDKARKSQVFGLPGKVVLTLKLDRQVASSSAPAQSGFPSQAFSNGMNLTELVQKKYFLSINCLTGWVGGMGVAHQNRQKNTISVRVNDMNPGIKVNEAGFSYVQATKPNINMKVWPVWHSILQCLCVSLEKGTTGSNCDSLKYAAVASMASITITIRTVISTLFFLDALSLWVFGAVMGFLRRPGCGTTGGN